MPVDSGPSKPSDPPPWSGMPKCVAYHWASAFGSRALRKMPPMPTAFAIKDTSWASGVRCQGSGVRGQFPANSYQKFDAEGKRYLCIEENRWRPLTLFAQQIFE